MSEILPEGVCRIIPEQRNFVSPNLSVSEQTVEPSEAQVVIVSAAGAVGKSTLGKAIALRKNAILWDLAIAPEVGGSSLDGMLSNTLRQGKEDFVEYMSEGYAFVVIDALDEGRLKVNENTFRRLLENVATLAKGSKGICFVLLGRKRIAEESWLVLEEDDIRTTILSIEPFSKDQANAYIANALSPIDQNDLLYECRDLIFDQLAFSVSEQTERDAASEFLHYPPVLDVVATLLRDESNLMKFKNSLDSLPVTTVDDKSIALIQKVIVSILEREQEKVLPRIQEALSERAHTLGWSNWNSLYSIDEQSRRLLGDVLKIPIVATSPDMPRALRSEYDERIKTGLDAHPLLNGSGEFANSVFKSYLYAGALRGSFGSEIAAAVTRELLKPEQLPIRLVAEFYLSARDLSGKSSEYIVPEHIGILYDSLLSSESTRHQLRLSIDGPNPIDGTVDSGPIPGEFEFISRTEGVDTAVKAYPFMLDVSEGDRIDFARFLQEAFITVPCTVEIGNATRDFQIGPRVQISASHIRILSESLAISRSVRRFAEEPVGSVILESLTCESHLNNRPIVYDAGTLLVSWEGDEHFPWTEFRMQRASEFFTYDAADLHRTYIRFRRIALNFRANGRGSLAKTKVKIEDDRVMNGELGRTLLAQLLKDQIFTLSEGFYFWNAASADALLGVSWENLRKGECPATLRAYLGKFIERNPDIFE